MPRRGIKQSKEIVTEEPEKEIVDEAVGSPLSEEEGEELAKIHESMGVPEEPFNPDDILDSDNTESVSEHEWKSIENEVAAENNMHLNIYLNSPDDEEYVNNINTIRDMLSNKGFTVYTPGHNNIAHASEFTNSELGLMRYAENMKAIDNSDIVITLNYGKNNRSDANWVAGYAFGTGKKVIMVEMPSATSISIMDANGRFATIKGIEGLKNYDFASLPRTRDIDMEQK